MLGETRREDAAMPRRFFDPQTGEYFEFGPDQQPPPDWKPLGDIPEIPFGPPGATVSWIHGMEPRLWVDPATGRCAWKPGNFTCDPGWKPLVPRWVPPPGTAYEREFFDPQTGDSYNFGPGEQPPPGWKKLRPVPPLSLGLPQGSTVSWIPGMEPRLYVDPATGESRWIHFGTEPPQGWKRLLPRMFSPPGTDHPNEYFDPHSGHSYNFGPGQRPPAGWKKLKPVPPLRPPSLPEGSTVSWIPGHEPRLFVDPETGASKWGYGPFGGPKGWLPLSPLLEPPPGTDAHTEYFDPATGASAEFGPDSTPPAGWKPVKPVPPLYPGLGPGATVSFIPGMEPVVYIDPATGETRWVHWGDEPPAGWRRLVPRLDLPQGTRIPRQFCRFESAECRVFAQDEQPGAGWSPMDSVAPVTGQSPVGGVVSYPPGQGPQLYVLPADKTSRWVQPGEVAPAGWLPATSGSPALPSWPANGDIAAVDAATPHGRFADLAQPIPAERIPVTAQEADGSWKTRFFGGLKTLGGILEGAVGVGLLLVPEPTLLTKAGGVVVTGHAADSIVAGLREVITGRPADTLTATAAAAGAESLGASPKTAHIIGTVVDVGVGFAGPMKGAALLKEAQLAKAFAQIETADRIIVMSPEAANVARAADKLRKFRIVETAEGAAEVLPATGVRPLTIALARTASYDEQVAAAAKKIADAGLAQLNSGRERELAQAWVLEEDLRETIDVWNKVNRATGGRAAIAFVPKRADSVAEVDNLLRQIWRFEHGLAGQKSIVAGHPLDLKLNPFMTSWEANMGPWLITEYFAGNPRAAAAIRGMFLQQSSGGNGAMAAMESALSKMGLQDGVPVLLELPK
jgi:hypothetical protein